MKSKTKSLYLLILICFIPMVHLSQNLVPNGDFEESSKQLPRNKTSIISYIYVDHWIPTSKGTPDYYHPRIADWKKFNNVKYPCVFCDNYDAKHGIGYVGIGTFGETQEREFIKVKLNESLLVGETYHFEMWVRASHNGSKYFTSGLGAHFSDTIIRYENKEFTGRYFIDVPPHVYCDSVITNTKNWQKIEADFVAKGNEKYLSIGYFIINEERKPNINLLDSKWPGQFSYLYIDDVKLEKSSARINSITLPSTIFATASSTLNKMVIPILKTFSKYLSENPTVRIKVVGHTDNIGDSADNLALSLKRANSIKKYIVSQGVVQSRIQIEGKGDTNPVSTNETNDGRRKNRRVEVELIED